MSFNTNLTTLLKTDPRFVDDEGELLLATTPKLMYTGTKFWLGGGPRGTTQFPQMPQM